MELNSVIDIILHKEITNIDQVIRFNGTPVHRRESVSEHSYWVALFASVLCEEMFVIKRTLRALEFSFDAITSCIFHDFDETITGDVLFTLKYNDYTGKDIKKSMQIYVEQEMKITYKGNTGDTLLKLIPVEDRYSLESFIKICDWLACIKYLRQEGTMGNTNVNEIMNKAVFHIRRVIDGFCNAMTEEFGENFNKQIFDKINKDLYNVKLH